MILVFGSVNVDLVARAASIPRPGETVLSPGYDRLFGGKGANQAVAAARASRGRGVAVAMAARVGDDEFGRAAITNLRSYGVDVERVVAGPEPTGCAFIVVDASGENAITVASGANGALGDDGATSVSAADTLVLQMEVPVAASLATARRARAAGARVIWNFAPAPADFAAEDLAAILAASDLFVVNEHEAVSASLILGGATRDPEDAAARIAGRGPIVILTAGSRGAVAVMPDGARHRAEARRVQVVDTTGAGDTFTGVLAAELAQHGEIRRGLDRACLAASLACESVGAQLGMPDSVALDLLSAGAA